MIAVAHRLSRILVAMLRYARDFEAGRAGIEHGFFIRRATYRYRLTPAPPGRLNKLPS